MKEKQERAVSEKRGFTKRRATKAINIYLLLRRMAPSSFCERNEEEREIEGEGSGRDKMSVLEHHSERMDMKENMFVPSQRELEKRGFDVCVMLSTLERYSHII